MNQTRRDLLSHITLRFGSQIYVESTLNSNTQVVTSKWNRTGPGTSEHKYFKMDLIQLIAQTKNINSTLSRFIIQISLTRVWYYSDHADGELRHNWMA